MDRCSGILMPVFSLPSAYGIGSFGKESYDFIDFLKKSSQKIWQVLPLVQTGYGNSPYSSVCSESYNPFFIDIENLKEQKLLTTSDLRQARDLSTYIDYGKIYNVRFLLLRRAFNRFDKDNAEFKKFIKSKRFLDYAIFMSAKTAFDHKPFYEWENGLKFRDKKAIKDFCAEFKDEILFWQFIQFTAEKDWLKLKRYANKNGVKILGDMPLYTALDSVDVWANPELYKLDENLTPKKIAGVPPDYFSKTGQLWGNPVYNYSEHIKDGFSWWQKRIKNALKKYDAVRIDHFRGLDRYYEVENGAIDATCGEWVKVPGEELFSAIKQNVKKGEIVAEDLGIIDDGVRQLLKFTGYPGMKILSFAFNGEKDNLYLPENITENSVCYTGTHDNDTLLGLVENASSWDYNNIFQGVKNSLLKAGIHRKIDNVNDIIGAITELGFYCKSKWFIMPYQDVLGFNSDYRINEPGTVKQQNWAVRFKKSDFKVKYSDKLLKLTKKYGR